MMKSVSCSFCRMGMYHNPFLLFLCPFMIMVPLLMMLHSSPENTTLQPVSHIFVTDMRVWFFILVRMYPCLAGCGISRSSWHEWDDRMVDWSGKVT